MIEFIGIGVAIVLPLVYVALTVLTLHAASFAAHAGAREAARVFMSSDSVMQGNAAAQQVLAQAFIDHGVDSSTPTITVTCTGGPCMTPGSILNVAVVSEVPLPWVPRWGDGNPVSFPVTAESTILVDQFRQAG